MSCVVYKTSSLHLVHLKFTPICFSHDELWDTMGISAYLINSVNFLLILIIKNNQGILKINNRSSNELTHWIKNKKGIETSIYSKKAPT